jgi:hypothetical protein
VSIAANQRVQLGAHHSLSGYDLGSGWRASLKIESMF